MVKGLVVGEVTGVRMRILLKRALDLNAGSYQKWLSLEWCMNEDSPQKGLSRNMIEDWILPDGPRQVVVGVG